MTLEELLENAAQTVRDREQNYGHTWDQVGAITQILYPDGITLDTADEHAAFHILQWNIGKLVRYANSSKQEAAIDSIHDAGIYSFILELIERERLSDG